MDLDEFRALTHDEEIALRLIEGWLSQPGYPASFDKILENYDKALEHLGGKS